MTVACILVLLAHASVAFSQPAPPPPGQSVAVTARAVTWVNSGEVFSAEPPEAQPKPLQHLAEQAYLPQLSSSSTAVAGILGNNQFAAAVNGPLAQIPQPAAVSGGGCTDWQPLAQGVGNFVLAGSNLVSAASDSACPGEKATSQPLFVRGLASSRWRVLRWLASAAPPMLAGEGNLLAVGEQFSTSQMRVTIINLATGRTKSRFLVPYGYLAFAGSKRLVLSIGNGKVGSFPLGPFLETGSGIYGGHGSSGAPPYRLVLYSTAGSLLEELGTATALPLVSGLQMIVKVQPTSAYGGETQLELRSIAYGTTRPLIGFNGPRRVLYAASFRWPTLALVQGTREALPASAITCESGFYSSATPELKVFNLTRTQPFNAAPPPSQLEGTGLVSNCPIKAAIP